MEYIIIENEQIGEVKAKLLIEKNPKTCRAIWDALPFDVSLSRWGEELYGDCPASIPEENTTRECEIGDIGYWISGQGFCIFWGPTPASSGAKPVAATPVNIFARIEGDAKAIFNQFSSFKGTIKKGD